MTGDTPVSLATTAETQRLARLLRCEPRELSFLRRFDAGEVRALRLAVVERMHADHGSTYGRIASASRMLPLKVVAPLTERMLPARVSAGVVAALPADHAAALATRMSVDYVADVSTHLSPTHAGSVLARLPVELILRVAGVLETREDYDTMAEVVAALTDEHVDAVLDAIEEPATLVQVALRITDEQALERLTGAVSEARLQTMVAWASRRTRLWPELTSLLDRLPAAQRERLLGSARR